jgi:hypothetical protein
MTKKHFIAMADAIRAANTFTPEQLNTLADFCRGQNPNFNRERWLGYIAGRNGQNGGRI